MDFVASLLSSALYLMIFHIPFLLIIWICISKSESKKIFIFSFLWFSIFTLINEYVQPLGRSSDEERFKDYAFYVKSLPLNEALMTLNPLHSYTFSWILGMLGKIFLDPISLGKLAIDASSAFAVVKFSMIQNALNFNYRQKYFGIIFILLTPDIFLFSSVFLREAISMTLLLFWVHALILYSNSKREKWHLYMSLLYLIIAALFSSGLIFFIPIYAIMIIFLNSVDDKDGIIKFIIMSSSVIVFLILTYVVFVFGDGSKLQILQSILINSDFLYNRLNSFYLTGARSDWLYPTWDGTFYNLGWHILQRLSYFLFRPTFIDIDKPFDVLRVFSTLLVFASVFSVAFLVIFRNRISRVLVWIAVCVFLMCILFSIGSNDISTGLRHRHKFLPLFILVLVYSMGYIRWDQGKNNG